MERAGGQVLYWNGHRVMGILAMSRAIGDHGLRPYVICEPEVRDTVPRGLCWSVYPSLRQIASLHVCVRSLEIGPVEKSRWAQFIWR